MQFRCKQILRTESVRCGWVIVFVAGVSLQAQSVLSLLCSCPWLCIQPDRHWKGAKIWDHSEVHVSPKGEGRGVECLRMQ
jgi:hypothetical protein